MPTEAAAGALADLAPSPGVLSLMVLSFLAGATVPTYYFEERMRGFGRVVADRLPYKAPPGMDEQEALQVAAAEADRVEEKE